MAAAVCKDSQLQVAPWLSIVAEVKLALVDGHAEELEATDCGDCPSASRSGGFGLWLGAQSLWGRSGARFLSQLSCHAQHVGKRIHRHLLLHRSLHDHSLWSGSPWHRYCALCHAAGSGGCMTPCRAGRAFAGYACIGTGCVGICPWSRWGTPCAAAAGWSCCWTAFAGGAGGGGIIPLCCPPAVALPRGSSNPACSASGTTLVAEAFCQAVPFHVQTAHLGPPLHLQSQPPQLSPA